MAAVVAVHWFSGWRWQSRRAEPPGLRPQSVLPALWFRGVRRGPAACAQVVCAGVGGVAPLVELAAGTCSRSPLSPAVGALVVEHWSAQLEWCVCDLPAPAETALQIATTKPST